MNTITPFLASPSKVFDDQRFNEDFKAFLALALKTVGEPITPANLEAARFRLVDSRFGPCEDLRLSDVVTVWGQPLPISELTVACFDTDRVQLIHSLWLLETFDEVKRWLKALQVAVRLAYNPEGGLRGHLLLAETIIPMVESIEEKEYVLPNGDMASDAITRNLGIRAKVFALDRLRRSPHAAGGNSIITRVSRTVSKAKH